MFGENYFILEGHKPVKTNLVKWAKWFENAERHVAPTWNAVDVTVSTVFLGIDHQFVEGQPPLLFETMVFGGPLDGAQQRYTTWDEAREGHKKMVAKVKKSKGRV